MFSSIVLLLFGVRKPTEWLSAEKQIAAKTKK
jgi:hypothetical protein